MSPLREEDILQHPAPCQCARRLLMIAIIACALVVLATTIDLLLRAPHQDNAARGWMKALTLSAPAFQAAGTQMRHPEMTHPAVDLRFSPGLGADP